jgi:hypothetical protein
MPITSRDLLLREVVILPQIPDPVVHMNNRLN